ncbi:MAG: MFS transporter, partial [Thermomicrobiales bacterium]|nr:MFS transporter [Thermomicrobiales bacterium]
AVPNANDVQAIQALPEPIKGIVLAAFTGALNDVFLMAIPFVALAFIVSLFLKEIPLRTAAAAPESNAAPVEPVHAGI